MRPKVLFVDDEPAILNSLSRLFRTSAFEALSCSSGPEAIELLACEEVAVLVSDSKMPGMSGVDLLAKSRGVAPDTVKVMLTGYADLPTAIDAINRGEVYRFVVKPWDDDALVQTVREAVGRYQLIRSLKDADEAKLLSLAQTIELKDAYTRGHCDRVANYALLLAGALGFDERQQQCIKHGSWLHDCGKIGVPETILNKNGPLTDEEFAVIKNHPEWGADVAGRALLSRTVSNVILYHHERYDGQGYPAGLAGENIPIEARIVAVADVFDALTSDRPYRPGYSREKATEILRAMTPSHLDPKLLEPFLAKLPETETETGNDKR